MTDPGLLVMCVAAFAAVTVLLGFLAGVIRILTAVFPHVPGQSEARGAHGATTGGDDMNGVVAAISAAAAHTFPELRVTRIEEQA